MIDPDAAVRGEADAPLISREEWRALIRRCIAMHGHRVFDVLCKRHEGGRPALIRALAAAAGVGIEQAVRAHRITDQLTVLVCEPGHSAAKTILPDKIIEYRAGMWFATTAIEVDGLASMAAELEVLQADHRALVIRGELIPDGHDPLRVRRLYIPCKDDPASPYFRPRPRRWLGADLDSFPLPDGVDPLDLDGVATAGRALLPMPFRLASCWAQLTAGAGRKPGGRIRLFYWLNRPVSEAEAKRWLKGAPVDMSLYTAVQPHFTAVPRFANGAVDPVRRRSGVITGEVDTVVVPDLPEPVESLKGSRPAIRQAFSPGRAFTPVGVGLAGLGSAERRAYARLRRLAATPPGQRHPEIIKAAVYLLGLAKAGLLDPIRVGAMIKGVCSPWGDLSEVDRALEWAWAAVSTKEPGK
jgi:hypothetical protein